MATMERIVDTNHNIAHDVPENSLSDLSAIDSMDADSLRKLIRTTAGAFWGYALTDRKEIAEAMKLRLAHIGLTADIKEAMVAIDKWLNRTEGMPTQIIAQDITVSRKTLTMEEQEQLRQAIIVYAKTQMED